MSAYTNTNISHAIQKTLNSVYFWNELVDMSAAQSGPFDGGCLICAKAIQMSAGSGELVRITSAANNGQTEHYGLRINDDIFDFDGHADDSQSWIKRFKINESISNRDLYFDEGLDNESEIPDDARAVKAISKILSSFLSQ